MKILVKAVKMPGIGPNRCELSCEKYICDHLSCENMVVHL